VKKTNNAYLLFLVIIVTVIGLTYVEIIPNSYATTQPYPNADYNEQVSWQQGNMWHLGKNLSVGDSYTYKICDPNTIQTSAANYHYFIQGNENHNSSVCYIIKLDFVNLLNSDENQINSNVWVVQAAISDIAKNKQDIRYSVFHINAVTFEVRSADTIHPDTIKYANSLQKTLFSLFKYTAPEPQLLQIGVEWGEVTEALYQKGTNPHMTVIDANHEYYIIQNRINLLNQQNVSVESILDVFQVGYTIDIVDSFISNDNKKNKIGEDNSNVTNVFLISSDLPFPLSAVSYSPVHIIQPQKQFEFELVEFVANSKSIDLKIKPVVKEPTTIEESTESGVMELTFPDDMIADTVDDADTISVFEEPVIVIFEELKDELIVDGDDTDDEKPVVTKERVIENSPQQDDIDYSKIVGLAVMLIVMMTGFVLFKKLKEGKLKMNSTRKNLKKKTKITKKTIISFEEKLHIDIKTLTDDDNI